MPSYIFSELRKHVWEANMELPRKNLVLHTFGNVSGIDRENGIIAIKPSGVPYEELKPEMIVLLDLDGNTVDSPLNPSSDTDTHLVLYREFPSIGGIVHTHSSYATAWAQAQQAIPCFGTTHADYVYGDIPCTPMISDERIAGKYEEETGDVIVETFRDIPYEQVPMALVAGHGPFTWGESPEKAVYHSVILEELAKTALLTRRINPDAQRIKQTLLDKHFLRKHGIGAYYGQKKVL